MKALSGLTVAVVIAAFSVIAAPANAKSVFDQLNESAPRSIFDDIRDSAPRTIFDDIQSSAPISAPDKDLVGE